MLALVACAVPLTAACVGAEEPSGRPAPGASREALSAAEGPPIDEDFVPPTELTIAGVSPTAVRSDPSAEERAASTLLAISASRPTVLALVVALREQLDWSPSGDALDFRIAEVLEGTDVAGGDDLSVERPAPAGETCGCQRPHVRAGATYLVGVVRDERGRWAFARTTTLGVVWAPVLDDAGVATAAFPRGGYVAVARFSEGGAR